MKIEAAICYLITGRYGSPERMTRIVADWDENRIRTEVEKVPQRYKEVTKEDMSDYFGLQFFVEVVALLRNQVPMYTAFKHLTKVAQEKSLFYHNTQYERTTHYNSELPAKSTVDEGKEKEILSNNHKSS
jgi:hypothetical protein